MDVDERLRIETPEQIALELPVAGIGSRFLAVSVDTVLQVALYFGGFLILMIGVPAVSGRWLPLVGQIGPALAILFGFCTYWGYFAFFEIIWSGRTPGKRIASIRVIKDSGRPINAYEAIGRNILRAIDFLPAMYGVGVIVMMLNRNSRRVGDYLAGTVVVHDKRVKKIEREWRGNGSALGPTHLLTNISVDELVLIETYLQRRRDLDPLVRDEMAEQIAHRITEKTGQPRDPQQPIDEFLESVAQRVRDDARFR